MDNELIAKNMVDGTVLDHTHYSNVCKEAFTSSDVGMREDEKEGNSFHCGLSCGLLLRDKVGWLGCGAGSSHDDTEYQTFSMGREARASCAYA